MIIQNNYLLQCLDFGTICRLSNHHNPMSEFLVIPRQDHDALVSKAYQSHGYNEEESAEGVKLAAEAARHGHPHPSRAQGIGFSFQLNWQISYLNTPPVGVDLRSKFKVKMPARARALGLNGTAPSDGAEIRQSGWDLQSPLHHTSMGPRL